MDNCRLQKSQDSVIIPSERGGVMGRDMERRAAYNQAWKKENTMQYAVRVGKASGIPDAFETAKAATGLSSNAYLLQALTEKLIRDGYLKPEESQEN